MTTHDRELSAAKASMIDRYTKALNEQTALHISNEEAAFEGRKSALASAIEKGEEELTSIQRQIKCLEQSRADLVRANDARLRELDELERESGKRRIECVKKADADAMMRILQEKHGLELHAAEAAAATAAATTRTLRARDDAHSGDDIYSATPIPDSAPAEGQPSSEGPADPTPDCRSIRTPNASLQEQANSKRPYREVRNHGQHRLADQHDMDDMIRIKKRNLGRTISFAEVYRDGRPQYKHTIVEHPKGSGEWYILRCDEHGYHFKDNPLPAASKHLNGQDHDFIPRSFDSAVQHLGFRVLGCNAEKANMNNEMCRIAYAANYQPPKPASKKSRNTTSSTAAAAAAGESLSGTGPGHEEIGPEPETELESEANANGHNNPHATGRSPARIAEPVAGGFYRYLYQTRWYVALVLPTESLEPVGMAGSFTDINDRPPSCYKYDKENKKIVGWAKGYEDNGPRMAERKYPVMTFYRDMVIPMTGDFEYPRSGPPLLSWALSKELRDPIDLKNPEGGLIGYHAARRLLARMDFQKSLRTSNATNGGAALSWRQPADTNEPTPAPASSRQESASLQADIAELAATPEESTEPGRDLDEVGLGGNPTTTHSDDPAQSLHQQTHTSSSIDTSTAAAPNLNNEPGATQSFASNAVLAAKEALELSFSLSLPSESPFVAARAEPQRVLQGLEN
ncbi:hypothetical protein B0T19DRAFT_427723 [Cercophora scortea]|uniref:Uncharacterized protein n=1 Tax=Cercophora scortea TaxID=314031 RepID=A0AAE0IFC9_9PEZI|nr:hypothetical protein B0T19DRAFT_427723 [Cercophora scortea]